MALTGASLLVLTTFMPDFRVLLSHCYHGNAACQSPEGITSLFSFWLHCRITDLLKFV